VASTGAVNSYLAQIDGTRGTVAVGPEALDVGGRMLPYVLMDSVAVNGHAIELGLYPSGVARLGGLGPKTDAFLSDLDQHRSRARRAALLQWTGTPEVAAFTQAAAGPDDVPVGIHVFADGLTVEPRNGIPELVPYALLDRMDRDGYAITLQRRGLPPVTVRRLGQRTDEFFAIVERGRSALRQAVSDAFGALDDRLLGFGAPDGWAVTTAEASIYGGALADAFAAGDRGPEVAVLASLVGPDLRYGLSLQPAGPMPFLLAVGRSAIAVESAESDQARATYVFATTDVAALNTALIMISFRREALYLAEDRLGRWSLAARTLPVVRWARSVFSARVVHDDAWETGISAALR
jgi:hypothetical protein